MTIVISAGYGSPALLLHGLPRANQAKAAILLVQAVGPQAALENLERAAAVPVILRAGLPMDGATVPENLERAVHLVRDGAHPVHHGPLERVARAAHLDPVHHGLLVSPGKAALLVRDGAPLARVVSLDLKDGTLEATDGVESQASPRDPSPRDPRPRAASPKDPRPRAAREDGAIAALVGAAAATLAGVVLPLESLASLVDHLDLAIGLLTQVNGLTMIGAVLESQARAAAVALETRGLTLLTTHGMVQESQARHHPDLETHGPMVATHGPTAATLLESQARHHPDLETHGPMVATHGPTAATLLESQARHHPDLETLPESLERQVLMKDGLLVVKIGLLTPQESLERQVLRAIPPPIQQQRPCHLTRNIQIAESLDGY